MSTPGNANISDPIITNQTVYITRGNAIYAVDVAQEPKNGGLIPSGHYAGQLLMEQIFRLVPGNQLIFMISRAPDILRCVCLLLPYRPGLQKVVLLFLPHSLLLHISKRQKRYRP
jgi:hypothetical protein